MRLGFIALLSRDWPMALGDSLNPDCTARTCRVPLLFMSILAKRLHPVVVAARIAYRPPLRWRQSLASMSRTRTGISRAWTRLGLRRTSMSRVWRHTGRASREHRITSAASVITAAFTGTRRAALISESARPADPRATHCYPAFAAPFSGCSAECRWIWIHVFVSVAPRVIEMVST